MDGGSGGARISTTESLPFLWHRRQHGPLEGAHFVGSDMGCDWLLLVALRQECFWRVPFSFWSAILPSGNRLNFSGCSLWDVREACLHDNSDRSAIAFRSATVTHMRHFSRFLGWVFLRPSMTNSCWSSRVGGAGVAGRRLTQATRHQYLPIHLPSMWTYARC